MLDVVNGSERARAWPKKRGKKLNPVTAEQNEWFRQAQWATKYMAPEMYWQVANAVKGTPLLPRDILTMMMAGRLLAVTMPDGRTMWSVQVSNDVSQALDVIADLPGSMLVRGPDGWQALLPGPDGYVLTTKGEGELPVWEDNGGGGGGGGASENPGKPSFRPNAPTQFTAGYYGARAFVPDDDVTITAVAGYVSTANTFAKVIPAIYGVTSTGAMGAKLAQGPEIVGHPVGLLKAPLDAPLALTRGQAVWVGIQVLVSNLFMPQCWGVDAGYFAASGALPSTAPGATYGTATAQCVWPFTGAL